MSCRYCPQCETPLQIRSEPTVRGYCSKCQWQGGPQDFLSEFKLPVNSNKTHRTPYVSIDLETTGLDPKRCQTLEFGAVIDNWHSPVKQLPRFHRYVRPRDGYIHGYPYALALNAEILRCLISDDPAIKEETCSEEALGEQFANWLSGYDIAPKHVMAAGKNFSSFDLQFLRQLPGFFDHVDFQHRAIDPAIFYWQADIDDALPGTKDCLERAGFNGHVAHTAIEDCISVIQLVRRGVRKCRLIV